MVPAADSTALTSMPKITELPPVPTHPELPPEVSLPDEEELTFSATDGVTIVARGVFPTGATRGILLCHPHPLYGGTMHNAVLVALAKRLAGNHGERVAYLRFNYRGVGGSGGAYGKGEGEILDARGGLALLHRRLGKAPLGVVGYSFGTRVGLRAAAEDGGVDRVALIAPAMRIFRFAEEDASRLAGRIEIVIGDRDDFCDVAEAQELSEILGARLHVVTGADHYFVRFRRDVANLVAPFVAPELVDDQ